MPRALSCFHRRPHREQGQLTPANRVRLRSRLLQSVLWQTVAIWLGRFGDRDRSAETAVATQHRSACPRSVGRNRSARRSTTPPQFLIARELASVRHTEGVFE